MLRTIVAGAIVATAAAQFPTDPTHRRAGAGTWNYDLADAANGPDHWPAEYCSSNEGKGQQSPVHLCGATNWGDGAPQIVFSGYDTTKEWTLKNPDTRIGGVQIVAPEGVTLKADGLAEKVGRADGVITGYTLVQMHLHWCSEHHIEGRQPPLEAHFVHMKSEYKDLGEALASGKKDALLVVGQFYELFSSESTAMTTIAEGLGSLSAKGSTKSLKAMELIDTSGGYYSYGGSLTTPTCNPVVTWVVMAKSLPITQASLEKFLSIQQDAGEYTKKHGNARPLMDLGTRTVYATKEVKSAACPEKEKLCTVAGPGMGMAEDPAFDAKLVGGILGGVTGVLLLVIAYLLCCKKKESSNEVIISNKPAEFYDPRMVSGFTMGVPTQAVQYVSQPMPSVQMANGVPMRNVHVGV